jgi:hypothetical protein
MRIGAMRDNGLARDGRGGARAPGFALFILGFLGPNLTPAALRHAVASENRAWSRRIARLALELRASTALLAGFERCVRLAVNLGGIGYETQRLGGRIIRIERRQRCRGSMACKEAERRQHCAGDESALDEGST